MVYSLDELRQEHLKGKRYKYLFFWGHTPAADGSINASCLSQWWMQDFVIDGITYSCAEQYMMAEKARLFQDEERLSKIMGTKSPKEMKAYGRQVQSFDKDRWDSCCFDIVKTANKAKFSQNPPLEEFLLSTGNRVIVEASPRDRVWGIGMGKQNPDAENPMKWRGRNLLGFALTLVRDELRQERERK